MKSLTLTICTLLLYSCATNTNQSRGLASSERTISMDQVYSAASGDFNGDNYADNAFLIDNPANEEYLELWVYLSDGTGHGKHYLATENKQFFYKVDGTMMSVGEPKLRVQGFENKPDTLIVSSEFWGIGRSASNYEIKFAHRNGINKLAGIEWRSHDRIDMTSQSCSYNMLSAKYDDGNGLKNLPSSLRSLTLDQINESIFADLVELCVTK